MAQRLSFTNVAQLGVPLLALLTLATRAASQQPTVLAHYDFEDESTPSGPDTHFIVRCPQGNVRLTPAVRASGSYSLEISNVAGGGDVSEFQGFIPLQKSGHVFVHFAFLVATPAEEFNIAFAGSQHFSLGKDGLAIWLSGRDGYFRHYSDSIWRKLFLSTPFVWYFVDIDYNVDAGVYDLEIRQEQGDNKSAAYLRLKLADVAYVLGDLEMERRLREAVYGSWRR
jgi:hypothetical protein